MILINAAMSKDIVYVDTMNLDGETNLKEKIVFTKDFTLPRIEKELVGHVVCDQPNESLDEWDGNIHFNGNLLNCR
jgi:magnesium-transporting ATPase (P-type)